LRVWDEFLTERDKLHLAAIWEKPEPFGFGETPALLVIDNYYSILGERLPLLEAIKTYPGSCGLEGWQAIDKTAELLAAARNCEIPVVYCHGLDGYPLPFRRGATKEWRPRENELPDWVRDRMNDIVDEIAPRPGELVIGKTGPSIFQGSPLQFYLTDLGIDTLIMTGNSTSGCVRASVVDGMTNHYYVGVVEDCVFDRTQASHAMSLFDMHEKYADVIDLAAAVNYFASVSKVLAPAG
jgi:nicotinamidase-related amidase